MINNEDKRQRRKGEHMKVLMSNGSPDLKGCISTALKEAAKILNAEAP